LEEQKGFVNMNQFRSKVDTWLVVVILAAFTFTLVQGFVLRNISVAGGLLSFAAAVFVVGLFLAVAVPCKYTLEADHLLIQSGFMKQRIAYRDIKKVEPSSSPLAAPALSLKRVKISYNRTFQLVSPRERELFIQLLQERTTHASKAEHGSGQQ